MPEYFLPRRIEEPEEGATAEIVGASEDVTSRETEDGIEIELPEGQRITIGTLPPGTVVEVISWQGTGSPGPKASRLLLGTARTEETTARLTAPIVEEPASLPPVTPEPPSRQTSVASTGRTIGMPRRRSRLRAWFHSLAWTAAAIALVLIPQSLGFVRWTVVDRGPAWALGGTRGSVAIASGTTDVTEGSRAIVRPEGSTEDWFGDAVTGEGGGLAVQVGSVNVPTEGRARTVRVIVPWIGYPAIWIRALLG